MKLFISIITTSLILFGCKTDSNKVTKGDFAFIGGEIVNPNNDFVVLSKSESTIDSIKLDYRNRFLYKIENLDAGLYTFKHGKEFQVVLLEPNDSVLFRLNTLDFDESLVFTGLGAKKNNYIINDFIENEKINKKVYKYCQLNPKDFKIKIDSLKSLKKDKLNTFKKKYPTSRLFNNIVNINNQYKYYFFKEVYPLWHRTNNKYDILKIIPKDFYNYRKDVNYNNTTLKNNFAYKAFLKSSFNNLALQRHFKKHQDSINTFKRMSLCYNTDKLNLIDSLVSNTTIKNDLLHYVTIRYLSRSKNYENNDAILNTYLSKSKDEKDKKRMIEFSNALNNLKAGNILPNVKIVDYSNSEFNINTIIESPTVINFWSLSHYNHFKRSHYKINELKDKYPEVKFITINIDDYGLEKSKKSLKNRFSTHNEYCFKNPKESTKTLAVHPISKTIIVNKDQKIVNGTTNIFSQKFEQHLLGLINE